MGHRLIRPEVQWGVCFRGIQRIAHACMHRGCGRRQRMQHLYFLVEIAELGPIAGLDTNSLSPRKLEP